MKAQLSAFRLLLIVALLSLVMSLPGRAPVYPSIFISKAQAIPPCTIIGGAQTITGNCTTTNYLLACNGAGGTFLGGALYACSSTGCDLGGGGFSIAVTCNVIDPGIFVEPILM